MCHRVWINQNLQNMLLQGSVQSSDPNIASRLRKRIGERDVQRIDPDPERSGAHGSDRRQHRERSSGSKQHLDPEDR
jgi:hypothetical protein